MAVPLDRVVIIGAGIGGLTAAIALRRAGYDVIVCEQAPAFATVGAGITIWANAIKALRALDVPEDALNGSRIRNAVVQDWRGRAISATDISALETHLGAPNIAVHRADLHRALLAALPEGTVRTGMAFTHFEQDGEAVTACFADGQSERAGLLVGADGIHSAVRRQMFPQVSLRYAGYIGWRGVAAYPLAGALDRTSESWGPGARFGIVPVGGGLVYWFGTENLPAGRKPSPAERKAGLLARFKGWHAPVEALIEATPEDKILYNDLYDIQPMLRWSAGRVTLLGDAAHATTPNLGQGACQAIESSLVLARCLQEESSLPAALRRYEEIRRPRAAWITNQSRLFGRVAQIESPWLCEIRNAAMRAALPLMMPNQLMKVAGHNL